VHSFLDHSTLTDYLLRRGYIDPRAVVESDLRLVEFRKRNHCYALIRLNGPSYLVKQGGASGRVGVAAEAHIYRVLAGLSTADGETMAPYLPRCYGFDEDEGVLALEYVQGSQTLLDIYEERPYFSLRHARRLARALSTLHRLLLRPAGGPAPLLQAMRVLSIHTPQISDLCEMSATNRQFVSLIQSVPELCSWLDRLKAEWRPSCLINADVKWTNTLVPLGGAARERGWVLKLVDWEFAGVGDPAWDLGSAFHDYLNFWLMSVPMAGTIEPQHFVQAARVKLSSIQPATRALWEAYRSDMRLEEKESERLLARCVRYAAARLLQAGLEHNQSAAALSGNMVYLVQVALKILNHPREAAASLLGIPWTYSAINALIEKPPGVGV
jgi:aminoglycoside phosphotransferase (APT) family kinase protein